MYVALSFLPFIQFPQSYTISLRNQFFESWASKLFKCIAIKLLLPIDVAIVLYLWYKNNIVLAKYRSISLFNFINLYTKRKDRYLTKCNTLWQWLGPHRVLCAVAFVWPIKCHLIFMHFIDIVGISFIKFSSRNMVYRFCIHLLTKY